MYAGVQQHATVTALLFHSCLKAVAHLLNSGAGLLMSFKTVTQTTLT